MRKGDAYSLRPFKGMKRALGSISEVHSYTMDLGFALGLLKHSDERKVTFHVDGAKYRPARLTEEDWRGLGGARRLHFQPRYVRGGVFHSKAWAFKKGLLLGSANLSIDEARYNLNFWCWMPGMAPTALTRAIARDKSCTVLWELDTKRQLFLSTPLQAIKRALRGVKLSAIAIASPQPVSRKLIHSLSSLMSKQGKALCFLTNEADGLDKIPGRREWRVRNYVPEDESNGLHGKAFYGEWVSKGKPGAVLYIGSANFTQAAYTGKNIESGILIKAGNKRDVALLQNALSALLGRCGSVSRDEKAWATERFNGRWKIVDAPENRRGDQARNMLYNEDTALSCFISLLKVKKNALFFPAHYGDKVIKKAELRLGSVVTRRWKRPAIRRFTGVVWRPDAEMKLRLAGGEVVSFSLPPLEGLMGDDGKAPELFRLLMNPVQNTVPIESRCSGVSVVEAGDVSIYSDSRVLVPWQTIVRNNKSSLLYNRRELKESLRMIREHIRDNDEENRSDLRRKLTNIAFCLECLLKEAT